MDIRRPLIDTVTAACNHFSSYLREIDARIRAESEFVRSPEELSDALSALTGTDGIIDRLHKSTGAPTIELPNHLLPILRAAAASYLKHLAPELARLEKRQMPDATLTNLRQRIEHLEELLSYPAWENIPDTLESWLAPIQASVPSNLPSHAEIEATVNNLISVLALKRYIGTRADFLVQAKNERFAIQVKATSPDNTTFARLELLAGQLPSDLTAFLVVTPDAISHDYVPIAVEISRRMRIKVEAIGLKDLASRLGASQSLNLSSAMGRAKLQALAITENFQKYSPEQFGLIIDAGTEETAALPGPLVSLTRQFPIKMLLELYRIDPNLNEILKINSHATGAIIVFSDIKNFSTLVKAARPVDVQEAMTKYYRAARDLTRKYNGVLDKFIGDAVLAIFNYPIVRPTSAEDSIRFATELIDRGREILTDLGKTLNDVIETGTRVGVASGDLSILDIGETTREIAFVGDSINLAARLEHESLVDGILIDNRTKESLMASNATFGSSLGLKARTLDNVKGQMNQIRCWQVSPKSAS